MWLISGAYGSPSASAASFQKIRDVGGTSLVDYQFADNFASGLVQDGHLIPAEGAINVLVMPVEPMQDFANLSNWSGIMQDSSTPVSTVTSPACGVGLRL